MMKSKMIVAGIAIAVLTSGCAAMGGRKSSGGGGGTIAEGDLLRIEEAANRAEAAANRAEAAADRAALSADKGEAVFHRGLRK
jgi:hypothetical protein